VAAPDQLWRRPVNRSVATFLGYRWFVSAHRLGLDGAATAALRPESLVVAPDGDLCGHVLDQRFTRGSSVLRVVVDDLGEVEATAPGVEVVPARSWVRLRVEPADVALLPW
jgi:hypothetical protein